MLLGWLVVHLTMEMVVVGMNMEGQNEGELALALWMQVQPRALGLAGSNSQPPGFAPHQTPVEIG